MSLRSTSLLLLAAVAAIALRQFGQTFLGTTVAAQLDGGRHTKAARLRPGRAQVTRSARGGADDDAGEGEAKPTETDRVKLKVLTPEGEGVTVYCSEAVLPSASGQLGVLAGHAPMMTALDVGVLRYKKDGVWKPLVVMAGFATVDSNTLSLLVNDLEKVEDIDLDAAKTELAEATSELEKADSKMAKLDASTKMKKAAARVQAAMFVAKK